MLNTVDIIGSGNVATRMALGLKAAGVKIGKIASRTPGHAAQLAARVGAETATLEQMDGRGADMVIIAVHDDAIAPLLESLPRPASDAVFVHTAGSVPMSVFDSAKFPRHGIFYPLQTMSRTIDVDWNRVPLFTEGADAASEELTRTYGLRLTPHVSHLDSAHRAGLHAAAVIGCNMAVYLWSLSEQVLTDAGLDFEVMRPLLEVTLERTKTLSPLEAMTGPARRGDLRTIRRHIESLPPEVAATYRTLSQSILKKYHPELSLDDNE